MAFLLLTCQSAVAIVLLAASWGKILRPHQFSAALRLSHMPEALIAPVVAVTPVSELVLAEALLISAPASLRIAFAAAAGLFTTFTLWMVSVSLRGLHVKCSCFGAGASQVGPRTILRNLAILGISIAGFILTFAAQTPLPSPSGWWTATSISFAVFVALLLAAKRALPAMALSRTKMRLLQALENSST